jgi:hypothetical protein
VEKKLYALLPSGFTRFTLGERATQNHWIEGNTGLGTDTETVA